MRVVFVMRDGERRCEAWRVTHRTGPLLRSLHNALADELLLLQQLRHRIQLPLLSLALQDSAHGSKGRRNDEWDTV